MADYLTNRQRVAAYRRREALAVEQAGGDPKTLPAHPSGRNTRARRKSGSQYAAAFALTRELNVSKYLPWAVDKEARALIESGEVATAAEAYAKAAKPPSARRGGRSSRAAAARRSIGKRRKTSGNIAEEADKRYRRLEIIVERIQHEYDLDADENARYVHGRLNADAWAYLRREIADAADQLGKFAARVDRLYEQEGDIGSQGGTVIPLRKSS